MASLPPNKGKQRDNPLGSSQNTKANNNDHTPDANMNISNTIHQQSFHQDIETPINEGKPSTSGYNVDRSTTVHDRYVASSSQETNVPEHASTLVLTERTSPPLHPGTDINLPVETFRDQPHILCRSTSILTDENHPSWNPTTVPITRPPSPTHPSALGLQHSIARLPALPEDEVLAEPFSKLTIEPRRRRPRRSQSLPRSFSLRPHRLEVTSPVSPTQFATPSALPAPLTSAPSSLPPYSANPPDQSSSSSPTPAPTPHDHHLRRLKHFQHMLHSLHPAVMEISLTYLMHDRKAVRRFLRLYNADRAFLDAELEALGGGGGAEVVRGKGRGERGKGKSGGLWYFT